MLTDSPRHPAFIWMILIMIFFSSIISSITTKLCRCHFLYSSERNFISKTTCLRLFPNFLFISLVFVNQFAYADEVPKTDVASSLSRTSLPTSSSITETFTVTANRSLEPASSVLAPVIVISNEEIVQSQVQSIPELLKRLPGINVAQSGGVGQQTSLFVRGTESRHVLILVDGIRLNQANISGSSDLSQIPLSLVQRIEYIRGARSAIYGSDAIGGVINLITQPENPDSSYSKISTSFGNHGSQTYQISTHQNSEQTRVYSSANYSRSQGTDVVANFPQAGSIRQEDKDGFKQYNIWLGAEHTFNSNWLAGMRGYAIRNKNKYDGFYSFNQPNALIDQRELESYTLDSRLDYHSETYQSGLILSLNQTKDFNYDKNYGKHDVSASIDDANQTNIQWLNRWQVGLGSVNAGVDWQNQTTKRNLLDDSRSERNRLTNTGIYFIGQQKWQDVTFEGALRQDHQSQFGNHSTWNVGVGYEFLPGYRIALLSGSAYKAPNLMQLYSQYGGNPNLQPEESQQYELILEGANDWFSWKTSAYKNAIKQLIDYQNQKYINIGEAELSGAEFELNIPQENLSHRLTFAYLDAKDKHTGNRLLRRPQKQFDYQLDLPIKDAELTLNYHLASKRTDQIFDNQSFTNQSVILPVDQQIDMALSYPFTNGVNLRARIADIFNQQRETVYGYRPSGRTFSITLDYTF